MENKIPQNIHGDPFSTTSEVHFYSPKFNFST